MSDLSRRRFVATTLAASAGALAAPSVARAQTRRLRMVTSWPKRLPGPGLSAERIASRVKELSHGTIEISVHAAGEIVPALDVLDAVGNGVADMGHTASFYWQGKMPSAVLFTTVPFGLTPQEHVAWVEAGGGQNIWDELYAPFGVKPFMGGNTGVCMGGWFRREIAGAEDMKGLKIRTLGLGGEVYRRLGATPVTIAPGEMLTSLQSGLVDGVEFVGPGTDIALGLYRAASFYYAPGFNKPNGTGECLVSLKVWESLDSFGKAVIAHACASEASYALSEIERLNIEALDALTTKHHVKIGYFPANLIAAARAHAGDILNGLAGRDQHSVRAVQSYQSFAVRSNAWANLSIKAVLEARAG